MGISSSQPVDDPPKSPKMDDMAAAQQLLAESAYVNQASTVKGETDSVGKSTEPASRARSARQSKRPRQSRKAPASRKATTTKPSQRPLPPAPRSYALADLQAYTEGEERPNLRSTPPPQPAGSATLSHVEVPDSQPEPTAIHTLQPTPSASSLAISDSPSETSNSVETAGIRTGGNMKSRGLEAGSRSLSRAKRPKRRAANLESSSLPRISGSLDMDFTVEDCAQVQVTDDTSIDEESPSPPRKKQKKQARFSPSVAAARLVHDSILPDTEPVDQFRDANVDRPELQGERRSASHNRRAERSTPRNGKESMGPNTQPGQELEGSAGVHAEISANPKTPKSSMISRLKNQGRSSQLSVTQRRVRQSILDPQKTVPSAERALDTIRDLHYPPDLRTSGDFSGDEEELLRRAIRDYQERKGLEIQELVDIIQWTEDDKDFTMSGHRRNRPYLDEEEVDSAEFWEEIKNINLSRKFESVKNHVRSKYHAFKSGGWTKEEDAELVKLYELHPKRWKLIAHAMGDRSMHDVHNRWRDYLQHGETRNVSTWTEQEENLLVRAITTVLQRDEDYRATMGKPPLTEYTNKDINWEQVGVEMNHKRSRLQSTVKWTRMKKRINPPRIQLVIKPRELLEPEEDVPEAKKKRGRPRKSEGTPAAKKTTPSRRKSEQQDHDETIKQAKKRRKLHHDQTSDANEEEQQARVPVPSSSPGMLWGDKLDLIEAIFPYEHSNQEDIPWHDIATAMKHIWSVRSLQSAFEELLDIVESKEMVDSESSLADRIQAIVKFLEQDHMLELGERYDPYVEVDSGEDVESLLASRPKSGRGKRAKARVIFPPPRSQNTRKRSFQAITPPAYKSTEIVDASDDAGSALDD
ncbi:hypothetical protein IQ07DRAFT_586355 [Pyrenochaeta sp. DS3sAY3a]|nr:hypothetical protein IQ07DRAFT_586355 [Pyrenochaeta sp. DS3sAY3a]